MLYKAEKWTEVFNSSWCELWAVVNSAGNPVAFGNKPAMQAYADRLNKSSH